MKKNKGLIIGILILVLLLAAYFVLRSLNLNDEDDQEEETTETVFEIDAEDIGQLQIVSGDNTFDLAWRIARANSVVALVAMYERPQLLPLNIMYGKNLIFKTGGVDAVHSDEILKLISEDKINTDFTGKKCLKYKRIKL